MKNLSAFLVKPKPKSSAENRQDSVSNKSNEVSDKTNEKNKQQATLEVVVNNSEKRKAEIIWTLKTVFSGYSIIQVKTFQTYFMRCFQIARLPRI